MDGKAAADRRPAEHLESHRSARPRTVQVQGRLRQLLQRRRWTTYAPSTSRSTTPRPPSSREARHLGHHQRHDTAFGHHLTLFGDAHVDQSSGAMAIRRSHGARRGRRLAATAGPVNRTDQSSPSAAGSRPPVGRPADATSSARKATSTAASPSAITWTRRSGSKRIADRMPDKDAPPG